MLRHFHSTFVALLVLVISSIASAKTPDIRGTWKRTDGAFVCGGKSAELVSIQIRQWDDMIQMSCRFGGETYTAPVIYINGMDYAEPRDSFASRTYSALWSDNSLIINHHEFILGERDLGTSTERWTLSPDGKQLTISQYDRVSVFKKNPDLGRLGTVAAIAVPSFIWLILVFKFRHNKEALDRLKGAVAIGSMAAIFISGGLSVSEDYKGFAPPFLIAGVGLLFVTEWIISRIPPQLPPMGEWWPRKEQI